MNSVRPVPSVLLATALSLSVFVSASAFAQEEAAPAPAAEASPTPAEETATALKPVMVEDLEAGVAFDSDEMDRKQAEDLEDVFRQSGEVRVGGARKNGERIYVRGIEDRSLNVTVDGARQSGYLFHHQGRVNVDPELMKRVEVEAGTGNALSGPGALGGAVRFTTKDPEDLLLPGRSHGALLKGGFATSNEEKSGTIAVFTKPTTWFSAMAYTHASESRDHRDGEGNDIGYTAAKPRSGLAKIVLTPSEKHRLVLSVNQREDRGERMMRSNFGYTVTQPITDQAFEFSSMNMKYDYTSGSPLLNLQAEVSDSLQNLESKAAAASAATSKNTGISVRNRMDFEQLRWYVGAEFFREDAEGTNSTRTPGGEEGQIHGVFTQAIWKPSALWRVSTGARFDEYLLTSMGGQEFRDSSVSPNLSLSYQWSDAISTSVGWAKAFKGSTPTEIFLLSGTQSSAPRPGDLEPTNAETAEVGVEYKLQTMTVNATVFQTLIQNPQVTDITAGVITRLNASDLRSEGWTLNYVQDFQNAWTFGLGYTHTQLRADGAAVGTASGGTHSGSGSGDRYSASLDYRLPDQNLLVTWNLMFVEEFSDVPMGSPSQPGYDLHDVMVTWQPTPVMRVNLGVYNLLNRRYVAQGTVYQVNAPLYEPGRDARISASYAF